MTPCPVSILEDTLTNLCSLKVSIKDPYTNTGRMQTLAIDAIKDRIELCISQLKAANEGQKWFEMYKYVLASKAVEVKPIAQEKE